ncbi:hypothetical protein CHS0354_012791 [Potamilus streckersoni]|uniref:CARD domain-containing protein n=1 Tax=Potamilus streckersoni TaxID=2493646 RepID=A0AAE0VKJ5_9BIVA|nr:hypothetical protein CHS0354_012791 [Potamilus streckersoni]
MDTHQKKALQKMNTALCDTLELDADLEANFVQCGLFTENKLEEIKAENTNKRRIQRMLKALQRRGPTAFDKFLFCIQDNYLWLAKQLYTIYLQEVNNTAPSSADLARNRKIELFVQNKIGDSKKLNKQVKQEISSFLLLHPPQQPHLFSGDSHSENHEQEILRKVFSMLTNEKTNGESTEPFIIHEEVSLDMIASEISRMSEQLRSLEKQLCYYKSLDISNITISLDEIKKGLDSQNEFKLKATREEIACLERELQQKSRTIQEHSKRIQQLDSQIQDLKMMCEQLKQINSHHQESTPSKSNDYQRSDLVHEEVPNTSTRSDLVHEEVPKIQTKFPPIHSERNIRPQKKRGKPELKSLPCGIGIGQTSSTHHKMWKY